MVGLGMMLLAFIQMGVLSTVSRLDLSKLPGSVLKQVAPG